MKLLKLYEISDWFAMTLLILCEISECLDMKLVNLYEISKWFEMNLRVIYLLSCFPVCGCRPSCRCVFAGFWEVLPNFLLTL